MPELSQNKEALEAAVITWSTIFQVLAIAAGVLAFAAAAAGWRQWWIERELRPLRQQEARETSARIAEAQARAAEANQKAEEEHLARVRIEERLAPRRLNQPQQAFIAGRIKAFAGERVKVMAFSSDAEVMQIAADVVVALKEARWKVDFQSVVSNNVAVSGIIVEVSNKANAQARQAAAVLGAALAEQGIARGEPVAELNVGGMITGNFGLNAVITVAIGRKM